MNMDRTKSQVLRYLGRKNQKVPEDLDNLIGECIGVMRESAEPRHTSLRFDIISDVGGIALAGTGLLLKGRDIANHLHGCTQAVLFAATLGAQAEYLIRQWERTDLTRALVLDACATQLIEEYCDAARQELHAQAAADGLMATGRFSPGYGDFPLDIQPQLLAILNAERRIGLTCTGSMILLPRKSVTALVGLCEKMIPSPGGCGSCPLDCDFRKDGSINECPRMD